MYKLFGATQYSSDPLKVVPCSVPVWTIC